MSALYTVMFTGHRPSKLGGYGESNPVRDQLKYRLAARLDHERAVQRDAGRELRCISGMALGFDQWAAEVCVDLGILFTAAVPFVGQPAMWPPESQHRYNELLSKAIAVQVVCVGDYAPWKMRRRNEWMADHADLAIAAWDGSSGGTANCVAYIRQIGKPIEFMLEKTK